MYPRLSDFFNDIFGTDWVWPIQSYGFFVAMAFITGAWILSLEFKRMEKENKLFPIKKKIKIGEQASVTSILSAVFFGFLIGFKLFEAIGHYSEMAANPQNFILSYRGSWPGGILLGLGSGFYVWYTKYRQRLPKPKEIENQIYPHELAGNILVIAGISGIIGAKLFHNLENIDALIKDPMGEIFSFSGLTFYGGLIVGFTTVAIYCKRNGIVIIRAIEAAAIVIPIAYAVGRLGCQVAGDGCWGIENPDPKPDFLTWIPDWLWAYNYPHNVINEGVAIPNCTGNYCHVLGVPVFPTSLYESLMGLTIFLIILAIRKQIKIPGMIFTAYLILAGIERLVIEQIRVNNEYTSLANFTQAEIISILLIALGITGIVLSFVFKNKLYELAQPPQLQNNNNAKK